MKKIVYHIATSIDGYISHLDGSVDGFLMEGPHATEFFKSLDSYDTVVMGKGTYDFGLKMGLKLGQAPYPMLKNYVLSKSIHFEETDNIACVSEDAASFLKGLKAKEGKNIWLCGGGKLAGSLLENHLIDELIIKVNPLILLNGIKLFEMNSETTIKLELLTSKSYQNGVLMNHYKINY